MEKIWVKRVGPDGKVESRQVDKAKWDMTPPEVRAAKGGWSEDDTRNLDPVAARFNADRQARADANAKAPGRTDIPFKTYIDPKTGKETKVSFSGDAGDEYAGSPPEGSVRKYPGGVPGALRGLAYMGSYGFAPSAVGTANAVGNYVDRLMMPPGFEALQGPQTPFLLDVNKEEKKAKDLYAGTEREAPAAFYTGGVPGMVKAPVPGSFTGNVVLGAVGPTVARVAPRTVPALKFATNVLNNGLQDAGKWTALAGNATRAGLQGEAFAVGTNPEGVSPKTIVEGLPQAALAAGMGGVASTALSGAGRLLQTPSAQRVPGSATVAGAPMVPPKLKLGFWDKVKDWPTSLATLLNEERVRLEGGKARFSAGRVSPGAAEAAIQARGGSIGNTPEEFGAAVNEFKVPKGLQPQTGTAPFRERWPRLYTFLGGDEVFGTGEKRLFDSTQFDAPAMDDAASQLSKTGGAELGRLRALAGNMDPAPVVSSLESEAAALSGNPVVGEGVANTAKEVAARVKEKFPTPPAENPHGVRPTVVQSIGKAPRQGPLDPLHTVDIEVQNPAFKTEDVWRPSEVVSPPVPGNGQPQFVPNPARNQPGAHLEPRMIPNTEYPAGVSSPGTPPEWVPNPARSATPHLEPKYVPNPDYTPANGQPRFIENPLAPGNQGQTPASVPVGGSAGQSSPVATAQSRFIENPRAPAFQAPESPVVPNPEFVPETPAVVRPGERVTQVTTPWEPPQITVKQPLSRQPPVRTLTERVIDTPTGSPVQGPRTGGVPVDDMQELASQFRATAEYAGDDPFAQSVAKYAAKGQKATTGAVNAHVEAALPPELAAQHEAARRAVEMGHAVGEVTAPYKSAVAAPHSLPNVVQSAAMGQAFGALGGGPGAIVVGRQLGTAIGKQTPINPARAYNLTVRSEALAGKGTTWGEQLLGYGLRRAREVPGGLSAGGSAFVSEKDPDLMRRAVQYAAQLPDSETAKKLKLYLSGQY